MSELEEKLNSVLSNPKMMQQIMSMAQSMGAAPPEVNEPQVPSPAPRPMPSIDPKMLQAISGFAQQSGVDRNQRALLSALGPYLSRERLPKLEKAMRAAKMARLASGFLGQGGLSLLTGR